MTIGAPPAGTESRRAAIYVAACAGLAGYSAAMLWCASGLPFRMVWYEPVMRLWILSEKPPTFVAMDYYSRLGLSSLVAAIAASIAFVAAMRRRPPPTLLRAAGIWAATITVLAMSWHAWMLAHRTIHPPPDVAAAHGTAQGPIDPD